MRFCELSHSILCDFVAHYIPFSEQVEAGGHPWAVSATNLKFSHPLCYLFKIIVTTNENIFLDI